MYKKLESLQNQENQHIMLPKNNSFQLHDPIKNLTNVKFSKSEINHISKGYQSNFQLPKLCNQIDKVIVESENIQNHNIEKKNELRYQLSHEINKYSQQKQNTTNNKQFPIKSF